MECTPAPIPIDHTLLWLLPHSAPHQARQQRGLPRPRLVARRCPLYQLICVHAVYALLFPPLSSCTVGHRENMGVWQHCTGGWDPGCVLYRTHAAPCHMT